MSHFYFIEFHHWTGCFWELQRQRSYSRKESEKTTSILNSKEQTLLLIFFFGLVFLRFIFSGPKVIYFYEDMQKRAMPAFTGCACCVCTRFHFVRFVLKWIYHRGSPCMYQLFKLYRIHLNLYEFFSAFVYPWIAQLTASQAKRMDNVCNLWQAFYQILF